MIDRLIGLYNLLMAQLYKMHGQRVSVQVVH